MAVGVLEDCKLKGRKMKETDKFEAAKFYIKEVTNNREDKITKDPNCPLNVGIFADQSVKDDQKSLQR